MHRISFRLTRSNPESGVSCHPVKGLFSLPQDLQMLAANLRLCRAPRLWLRNIGWPDHLFFSNHDESDALRRADCAIVFIGQIGNPLRANLIPVGVSSGFGEKANDLGLRR